MELIDAFAQARDDANVGVIILTGEGGRILFWRRPKSSRSWRICR